MENHIIKGGRSPMCSILNAFAVHCEQCENYSSATSCLMSSSESFEGIFCEGCPCRDCDCLNPGDFAPISARPSFKRIEASQ